jgi:hypothetical protein
MIDPQPTGMTERRADRFDQRSVTSRPQLVWNERRELPVRAVGIELIGRRPNRRSLGQHVLPHPSVGPAVMKTDGHVHHERNLACRLGQLLVQLPLNPLVKADAVSLFLSETVHRCRVRMTVLVRPISPVTSEVFGQRAEGCEGSQCGAASFAVMFQSRILGSPGPNPFEGRHLQPKHRIAGDQALPI